MSLLASQNLLIKALMRVDWIVSRTDILNVLDFLFRDTSIAIHWLVDAETTLWRSVTARR